MSAEIVKAVGASEGFSAPEKGVLFALGWFVLAPGTSCVSSVKRIESWTSLSRTTVWKVLADLVERGAISRKRLRRGNEFTIHMNQITSISDAHDGPDVSQDKSEHVPDIERHNLPDVVHHEEQDVPDVVQPLRKVTTPNIPKGYGGTFDILSQIPGYALDVDAEASLSAFLEKRGFTDDKAEETANEMLAKLERVKEEWIYIDVKGVKRHYRNLYALHRSWVSRNGRAPQASGRPTRAEIPHDRKAYEREF